MSRKMGIAERSSKAPPPLQSIDFLRVLSTEIELKWNPTLIYIYESGLEILSKSLIRDPRKVKIIQGRENFEVTTSVAVH